MTDLKEAMRPAARELLDRYSPPTLGEGRRAALRQQFMAGLDEELPPDPGTSAPASAATGSLKMLGLGVAAGLLLAGGAYLLVGGDEPAQETPRVASARVGPSEPVGLAETAALPAPADEPEPAVAPKLEELEPDPELEAKPKPKSKPRPKPKTRVEPKSPEGPDEASLMADAHRALRAGRYAEALRHADQHAREFPKGALLEAREATRSVARCHLEVGEREHILRSFERRFAKSPLARGVREACED